MKEVARGKVHPRFLLERTWAVNTSSIPQIRNRSNPKPWQKLLFFWSSNLVVRQSTAAFGFPWPGGVGRTRRAAPRPPLPPPEIDKQDQFSHSAHAQWNVNKPGPRSRIEGAALAATTAAAAAAATVPEFYIALKEIVAVKLQRLIP